MADGNDQTLLFDGNGALFQLLAELYPRLDRDQQRNRPLICLVRARPEGAMLPRIHLRFNEGLEVSQVQRHDPSNPPPLSELAPPTVADVLATRQLVITLTRELGSARDHHQRITRFPRFALVVWLMAQRIDQNLVDQSARDRAMRALLLSRARYTLPDIPNSLGVPGWVRPVAVAVASVLDWVRLSGRVPGLSGYYRWLRKPHSLAPRRAGGVPSIAEALTDGIWQNDPSATLDFLVNAFIEDIRAAYRAPVKRNLGRRRTTCCLLSISNITRRNGGYQLLQTINAVRNQTGLNDPLLVVTESQRVPPFAQLPAGTPAVRDAHVAYRAWQTRINEAQRDLQPAAWLLPLIVPPTPAGDQTRLNELQTTLDATSPVIAPREAPVRKVTRVATAALVIGVACFSYAWWSHAHCGNGLTWPGLAPTVSWANGECVGVTTDLTTVFKTGDPATRQLAETVQRLNAEVDDRHDQQPRRPVITLAYLGALSTPVSGDNAPTVEIEGIKGVAVAQRQQLTSGASTDPLVKVIFANAGQRMAAGVSVAASIGEAARSDRTVVGVVGLNESYRATSDTVKALAGQGIATVAATVSTDFFARELPMYYQIAPRNVREAQVAAAYAQHYLPPGPHAVRIYFSDDRSDVYSANLADDLGREFAGRGFTVEQVSFAPDGATPASSPPGQRHVLNAAEAGRDACDFPGLVLYAGRPRPDFSSFLENARNCRPTPRILADDDVTRYAANDSDRRKYPSVPFDYLAFAVTARTPGQVTPEQDFYNAYDRMFPADPGSEPSLDGHAALAYDAATTFIKAAQLLTAGPVAQPITPGSEWGKIGAITNPGLRGASGYVDFGGRTDRNVPNDKSVLVLRVRGGEVEPTVSNYCGPPPSLEPRTQPWCPFDVTPAN